MKWSLALAALGTASCSHFLVEPPPPLVGAVTTGDIARCTESDIVPLIDVFVLPPLSLAGAAALAQAAPEGPRLGPDSQYTLVDVGFWAVGVAGAVLALASGISGGNDVARCRRFNDLATSRMVAERRSD